MNAVQARTAAVLHRLSDDPRHAVAGWCAPRFEPVRDAFIRNFADSGELGASLTVEIDGEPQLDLWGGYADAQLRTPWERDSLSVVFSNTKPATALCAHLLAQDGLLDLDRPVHHYWPAFGDSARRAITPRMFLDHSAGLPALREPLPDGTVFDWEAMVGRLEREAPFWEPGTRVGYHGLTFGWLVGELVRRVSGISVGDFFQQRIAAPLKLDFWIGLPEQQEARVAPIVPAPPADKPRNAFEAAIMEQPESITALYFRNTGGWRPSGFNKRIGHEAQIPAANGITNARSLARLYGTLAMEGARGDVQLIYPQRLKQASEVSSATHLDACLLVPTRFGAGFMRSMDNRARGLDSAALGDDAFGHVGAGGSVAFASPRHRMGFAYTMNQMGPGVLLNGRADRLIDATYRALA
jgi:CubicO group peptidase (beta-lactamase class C family)